MMERAAQFHHEQNNQINVKRYFQGLLCNAIFVRSLSQRTNNTLMALNNKPGTFFNVSTMAVYASFWGTIDSRPNLWVFDFSRKRVCPTSLSSFVKSSLSINQYTDLGSEFFIGHLFFAIFGDDSLTVRSCRCNYYCCIY